MSEQTNKLYKNVLNKGFSGLKTCNKPKKTTLNENKVIQSLMNYFEKIKRFTANSLKIDFDCKEYYQRFFQEITFDNLITDLTEIQVDIICKRFVDEVYDRSTMITYLENTPGLYVKVCLWAINNPCPFHSCIKHDHHMVPLFLNNYDISENITKKSYNIVGVDLVLHFVLHTIRFIEYQQPEDSWSALYVIGASRKSIYQYQLETNNLRTLFDYLEATYSVEILAHYPELQSKHREESRLGSRQGAHKHLWIRLN